MIIPLRGLGSSIAAAPRVALLEARMGHELARLVEKHGGEPVCVPALEEVHVLGADRASELVTAIGAGAYDVAVFMTGVAVSVLFELAEQIGRRPELVAGLRAIDTVCRGPKPTAALRGFGVTPTLGALDSFTSAEVIDAVAGVALHGRRVLLFHCGERSGALAETLIARRAVVDEQWLYRWRLPRDTSALAGLVTSIIGGRIDAVAVTCQVQVRHLFDVAQGLGLERDLIPALNARTVVGAVGPTCRAVLETFGVEVPVVPDHPKMGPLVVSLMSYLARQAPPSRRQGGAS